MEEQRCPVCGKTVFEEHGDYEICPVCKWENDGVQFGDHNYAGGANSLSVNEARIEYFLLNNADTCERAEEIYLRYTAIERGIIENYQGIDHSTASGEQKADDLNKARTAYMDELNELLMSRLDDGEEDDF